MRSMALAAAPPGTRHIFTAPSLSGAGPGPAFRLRRAFRGVRATAIIRLREIRPGS